MCCSRLSVTAGSSYQRPAVTCGGFWTWQVVGNLAGLASVITITVMRFLPLSVVFPVTTGLTVIGIQVVAAGFLFRESISPIQWLGTLLVVVAHLPDRQPAVRSVAHFAAARMNPGRAPASCSLTDVLPMVAIYSLVRI